MATTPGAIRDRMAALVVATVPTVHQQQRFRQHTEQERFDVWCNANPASCLRTFSIRPAGDTTQAVVTDHQLERVEESVLVMVAYPADYRHGGRQLLGLDDVIASDAVRIEAAIGVPSADATLKGLATIFRESTALREESASGAVVFLTIPYLIEYARSLV